MKNVQHQDVLLEQAIDIRAARTLCRDGWSCEQINAVLKNTEISSQEFETIQAQSRELDKLQKVFGSPIESLYTGHNESDQSELDFLNRGPDAAASVLRANGWNSNEISLVIQEGMFAPLDEPAVEGANSQQTYPTQHGAGNIPMPAPAPQGYGYQPGRAANMPAVVVSNQRPSRQRSVMGTFGRDVFILMCLAGATLAIVYALLQ